MSIDIDNFEPIKRKEVFAKKDAFKNLIEEGLIEKYENEFGMILIGEEGIFYENKLFPKRDYTYSNNFNKRLITDNEVKRIIEKLKELRTKVNENNSIFFYYGFMYKDGEIYELNYNFHRDEKEEVGEYIEEIPEVIKIKIYSDINTVFNGDIKDGIIVVLKLPEKNVLVEVPHEDGNIENSDNWYKICSEFSNR